MLHGGCTVLVGDERRDPLLPALARELAERKLAVRTAPAETLGALRLHVDESGAWLDGMRLRNVVFRVRPSADFAGGFASDDAPFVSSEIRALWLHVLTLPATTMVNRGDVDTWFVPSEWAVWRRRFVRARVPVTPLAVGPHDGARHWLQWSGARSAAPEPTAARALGAATVAAASVRRVLWCAGAAVDADDVEPVRAAGHVLEAHGVALAGLDLDEHDHLVGMTSFPSLDADAATVVARRLAGVMYGPLDRR